MKLWPATTENKYFVKMLWHLLSECVKTTVLLVCSICTFFFNHRFMLFFLILYKKARMRVQCFYTIHTEFSLFIYSAILLSHFVFFFFFFKFWTVARGVHGSGWVGLRRFFYLTHYDGSKKIQLNPTYGFDNFFFTIIIKLSKKKKIYIYIYITLATWVDKKNIH